MTIVTVHCVKAQSVNSMTAIVHLQYAANKKELGENKQKTIYELLALKNNMFFFDLTW